MYSLLNIGCFIGPFIGGLLIEKYGFIETFGLAAFLYLIAFLISLMLKIKLKKKPRKKIDRNLIENIIFYFKKKDLIKAYFLTFSSSIWYAMIFTYIPLFIIGTDLTEIWVGIFLASTQLPLVFIQFKLNWFVKKIGMKRILIFAYSYLTIITLILFFYSDIYFTMVLLSTTAFALGFIEPLREIYFFKNVKNIEEEKTYPIFNTSFSIGSIFGKMIIAGVLLILPQNFTYLTISILMGITVLLTLNIKNYKQ